MSNTPKYSELMERIAELENELAKTQLQQQENSEIRLNSIINESPFPIAIADSKDEKVLYWSRSAKKMFGHSPKNVSEWYELAYPDKAYRKKVIEQWKPHLNQALETRKTVNTGEYEITCKDGSVKICELYVQLTPDNLIVTFNEITQSKKAEEALIKHQAILKNAEDISDVGSFELDIAKGIFTFSEGWMRIHGCTKNTFTLEELLPIAHPEDHPKVHHAFDSAVKHLRPYQVEHRIIRQDNGEIRIIRASAKIVCDDQGTPLKLYGSVQDITESKLAEKSLKESEKNIHFLNDMTTEALQMKNIKSIYDYISSSLQKLLPDTIVLFLSVDDDSKNTCLENVHGIKNHLFEKILSASGVNPVGKSFNLLPGYNKLHRTGKLVEFKNGLVDFSAGQFPPLATKSIEKIIDLHKIYTIGITKEHKLLANLHFFTFNKKEITNTDFIEAFVKQAGMILQIKQAEHSLQESEERYRKAQKLGKVGNWEYDPHTAKFWASEETKRIFGFDPKEKHFTTESVESCIPDRERVNKALMELIENGTEYNLEYEIFTHDTGEQKTIVSHAQLERDEHGNPLRVTGVIQDITEQNKAELALKESEQKFKSLFSSSADAILLADAETGIIVDANNAASQLFEKPIDDIIGMHQQDLHPQKQRQEASESFKNRPKSELSDTLPVEIDIVKKSGQLITVEIRGRIIKLNNKELVLGSFRDISGRKKVEKKIKEKNEQFETIIKGANLGWWDWDIPSGNEIYNEILAENLGYKLSEIKPSIKWWEERVHPDDAKQLFVDLQEHFNGNTEFFENKHRLKTKTGQWKWFHDFGKVVEKDSKGNALRMIGTLRDIDYEERAKEKINASLQQIEMINANTPNVIWKSDVDKNGKFHNSYISEPVDKFLALPKGSINNDWDKFFPYILPEYLHSIDQVFKDGIESPGKAISLDFEVKKADGKHAWLSLSGRVVHENNKLTAYGSTIDITEKKQAEEALKESEEKYRVLVDNLGEGIAGTVENEYFIFANKAAENIFGVEPGELIGKTLRDFVSEKEFDKVKKETLKRKKGEKSSYELEITNAKNEKVHLMVTASPRYDDTGNYKSSFAVFRDITESKKMQNALQESEETLKKKNDFIEKQNIELTKLNEDKDKFMSVLAHDLKNPFNTLLGFSELLNKNIRTYDIDKIEKQVKVINSTAHNTYHLLEDILLWSRSQSGKITYKPGDFDLGKACKSIIKEANSRAQTKGIKIKCNVSDQLQVYTDINLVKTILRNLISNAIKFTNQGGTATIDAKETENETIVSVADTGVGIKKDTIPELFNIAVDNTRKGTHNEEGTGLGLQICKDFVEKMGGKIWVESEVNNLPAGVPADRQEAGGSVFYFTIPK